MSTSLVIANYCRTKYEHNIPEAIQKLVICFTERIFKCSSIINQESELSIFEQLNSNNTVYYDVKNLLNNSSFTILYNSQTQHFQFTSFTNICSNIYPFLLFIETTNQTCIIIFCNVTIPSIDVLKQEIEGRVTKYDDNLSLFILQQNDLMIVDKYIGGFLQYGYSGSSIDCRKILTLSWENETDKYNDYEISIYLTNLYTEKDHHTNITELGSQNNCTVYFKIRKIELFQIKKNVAIHNDKFIQKM